MCPVTGVTIDQPRPQQRFVSAAMLRTDDDLLLTLDSQHRNYTKGSKEDLYNRAAHNVRNKDSNPRNNLRRRINRIVYGPGGRQIPLFALADTVRLSNADRAVLSHWRGTPYDLGF